ncbi:MAG: NigD-like C-terminal domain-containing protein [Bacteroidales bacterium]|nr:NigD-like C-terminal domain-containing protein [Bacteroidales bacterium]
MKNFKFILGALAVAGSFFTSCDDDDDDVHYESIVSVEKNQTNTYFFSDKGNVLWPVNQTGMSAFKEKERAIILFNLAEKDFNRHPDAIKETNEFIKLTSYQSILTKPVWNLTQENKDSIVVKNSDPVSIHNAWIGGGYINLIFGFETAYIGVYHYVNVVNNTIDELENPKDGVYKLDFIHNSNGDGFFRYVTGIASFKLPDNIGDAKNLEIRFKRDNSEIRTITLPVESVAGEKLPTAAKNISETSFDILD